MHPRITVHEVCFPESMDIAAMLQWSQQHGIGGIGLFSLRRANGWTDVAEQVARARSSTRIAYLCHAAMFQLDDESSWPASTERLIATIDAAKALGSPLVYATTGPAGRLEFEEAVDALTRASLPVRKHAAVQGIRLLTETTSPAMCFTHFLHSFADTVEVAKTVGIGLCLDLHPTWHERAIRRKISEAASEIALVQVADHIPRNTTIARDIVGDGIIPLERLLGTLLEAGYTGPFDLELFGRPPESALTDTLKSCQHLSELLHGLGA